MHHDEANRREFLRQAVLAGTTTAAATSWLAAPRPAVAARSPNEKLNIGCIGVAAQAEYDMNNVATENIVALCDIDSQRLGKATSRFPKAKSFSDYRKLLDEKDLDAVVVATPDHSHAIAAVWALQRGLDVYCEKPLAHSVHEVRKIRDWTAKQKAVTQMGTQIHAGDNYRRAVEIVKAGVLGKVGRVHVWMGGKPNPGVRVAEAKPPAHVDYELWTGPAPLRPFHVSHFHFQWRYWWDYGNGILGDFGCHYMDLPFWALDLRYPTSVEAKGEKTYKGDNEVPDNMQVDYQFPARGELAPVHLTWYHGAWRPPGAEMYGLGSAVLFEGERGRLLADYGSHKLFMNEGVEGKAPAPSIPRSIGHHQEWIAACKSRGPTTCNFDYSGALTESVLLGNVSYRAGSKKLEWDAERQVATNLPEAAQFIERPYRDGWKLEAQRPKRAMFFSWLTARRRRKLAERVFPAAWNEVLTANYADLPMFTAEEQSRLRRDVQVFVAEKNWEGCGGLAMTDEVKVTIAAQACTLLLGMEHDYFSRVLSILVYPNSYTVPHRRQIGSLELVGPSSRQGEAWYRGPVILSWDEVVRGAREPGSGHNLVWHEFAHQLDMLDSSTDGTPPLATLELRERWREVMTTEHRRLIDDARHRRPTLLDKYGTQNEAEFFAVATECFFDLGLEMEEDHPSLYALLRDYFGQDPAERRRKAEIEGS